MQVDTNVSEADVGRVRVGQPADFTVDAYPGQVFHGTVTSIRKAPINVQNVITYDVVIGVSNPDLKLFPGMTANVKILVDQRTNVLKVPNAALRYHPADAAPKQSQRPAAAAGGGRVRRRAGSRRSGCWTREQEAASRCRSRSGDQRWHVIRRSPAGDLKDGDRRLSRRSRRARAPRRRAPRRSAAEAAARAGDGAEDSSAWHP